MFITMSEIRICIGVLGDWTLHIYGGVRFDTSLPCQVWWLWWKEFGIPRPDVHVRKIYATTFILLSDRTV